MAADSQGSQNLALSASVIWMFVSLKIWPHYHLYLQTCCSGHEIRCYRYGSRSMDSFKVNLQKVLQRFKQILSPECLFIWNTTLPIGRKICGGFLLPDVAFMADILRRDVLEANFYCQLVVADYDFDVLDLHYYFRNQIQHRQDDGIHWDEMVHRRITNLILTHMCEAWGLGLPPKRGSSNSQVSSRQVEIVTGHDREHEQSHYSNRFPSGEGQSGHGYKPARRMRSTTYDPGYLRRRMVERVTAPCEPPLRQATWPEQVVELMQQDIINQNRTVMEQLVNHGLEDLDKAQGRGHLMQGRDQFQAQGGRLHGSAQHHLHQEEGPKLNWSGSVTISRARSVHIVNHQWSDYQQRKAVDAVHRPRLDHRHHRVKPFWVSGSTFLDNFWQRRTMSICGRKRFRCTYCCSVLNHGHCWPDASKLAVTWVLYT